MTTTAEVFTSPHTSAEFRDIALEGEILRTQVGSGVHGTAIEGQDDRDEMGICIERASHVIGLGQFEQYIWRMQPEGVRSGPGDVDLIVYGLRKWARLALQGNPTVLIPLFAPDCEVVTMTDLGRELRDHPELIVSRQAGHRFLGYSKSQREQMLGLRAGRRHTNRPELVEQYGFDTKFAMHMVRLGVQGVELLETGRITLPIPEPWLTWLRDLRQGKHTKAEAIEAAEEQEARIRALIESSDLPEHPDIDRANRWLIDAYEAAWAVRRAS